MSISLCRQGDRGITRRKLLIAIGANALATPLTAFAQNSGSMPRIGLLWIEGDSSPQYVAAFREGLRALGYIEGKNIQIEDRFLVKDYRQLPDAAAKLANQRLDIVLCYGATATQAVSQAASTIPIVTVTGSDLVKLGMAASRSRPGGNVTGMTHLSQELSGKRLDLLKEIVPGLRRVAVIYHSESTTKVASLRNFETAARALKLEMRAVEVRVPGEIGPAIAGIARMDVQAIAVVGASFFIAYKKQVVAAIEKARLPAIYADNEFPAAGGLLAYAPNLVDLFRRAATFVDEILKGAKPGDIPIEQPTKFELVVNMKTAKALGIKFPHSILLRADRVIE